MKIPKIILGRPKLVIDTRCPKCHSLDIAAIPIVTAQCKNCKLKFTSEGLGINIYFGIAKKLVQLISHNDEVCIVGKRDDSNDFNAKNMLMAKSQEDEDVYQTILAVKHNFEGQKCYEVSDVLFEEDKEQNIQCKVCGFCNNCVTCKSCGQKYIPKEVETKYGKEKRYKCTECGSKDYIKTHITKLEKECPYCKSVNVKPTFLNSDFIHCPKCKSKNITKSVSIPVYKLIIKRQERFKCQKT